MRVIDSKIDLGKSFEFLKEIMTQADEKKETISYAYAYGMLVQAVRSHLDKCTIPENIHVANADDIPGNLFNQ